ncbi:MAG: slipin family protein [Candidatus Dojkabacteria bacterium]
MFTKIIVKENERVIMLRNGQFAEILRPGKHTFFDLSNSLQFETHILANQKIISAYIDAITRSYSQYVQESVITIQPDEGHVGIVFINGKIVELVTPGMVSHYWKEAGELNVEYIQTSDEHMLVPENMHAACKEFGFLNPNIMEQINVPEEHKGLLYVNNAYHSTLEHGIYFIWTVGRTVELKLIDTRFLELEISGQEVLTKDRVTIRVNLVCYYMIHDAMKVVKEIGDYYSFVYKHLQFALRKAVESRTLDEVLDSKSSLDQEVLKEISEAVGEHGIKIQETSVKDIILPGEMREILNQVIQAEKAAQANLIKRREETAATRSLLNTAKLMDDHPMLLRLKEIEAVESILQKVENLSIFGGTDDLIGKILSSSPKK